jgi:hypothetical protein
MPTPGTNSSAVTRLASGRCSRAIPFLIVALACAHSAFALPLRYSSYLDGPAVIAAGPDGAIVSAATVPVPPFALQSLRVIKFAPATQSVVWSRTFAWSVTPKGVAVASDGTVWITGTAPTGGVPLINPLPGAASAENGAFIVHLSADGSTVLLSSVFGVSAAGSRVAIGPDGTVYWAGVTYGGGIPTTPGVIQPNAGGQADGFVARLTPGGAFAASYLGGSGLERSTTLAIGGDGAVYLAGTTDSTNLPTTAGAFQPAAGVRPCVGLLVPCPDGFVARLSADLTGVNYLTYLHEMPVAVPGYYSESISGIAVNAAGDAFVTGSTTSGASFPVTAGAFQTTCRVCGAGLRSDAFVARLNTSGSALVYSTFLSGGTARNDLVGASQNSVAIAVDARDTAWVSGWTSVTDFPLVAPYQSTRVVPMMHFSPACLGTATN